LATLNIMTSCNWILCE